MHQRIASWGLTPQEWQELAGLPLRYSRVISIPKARPRAQAYARRRFLRRFWRAL